MYFPSTHWTLLKQAALNGQAEGDQALEELCRCYWVPLQRFVRSRGYSEAEAEDLTQEFLLHLIDRSALLRPDRSRGKFRSFLVGALIEFLSHERERRLAQKRGGQQFHLSTEVIGESELANDPQAAEKQIAAFDRDWARTIIRTALKRLERAYDEAGKAGLFPVLREFLPGANVPPPYPQAAARAGMSLAAFNSEIHRLRQHFRDCICAEVNSTVSAPHEVDEEIGHLYRVLLDRGTDLGAENESLNGSSVSTKQNDA